VKSGGAVLEIVGKARFKPTAGKGRKRGATGADGKRKKKRRGSPAAKERGGGDVVRRQLRELRCGGALPTVKGEKKKNRIIEDPNGGGSKESDSAAGQDDSISFEKRGR